MLAELIAARPVVGRQNTRERRAVSASTDARLFVTWFLAAFDGEGRYGVFPDLCDQSVNFRAEAPGLRESLVETANECFGRPIRRIRCGSHNAPVSATRAMRLAMCPAQKRLS